MADVQNTEKSQENGAAPFRELEREVEGLEIKADQLEERAGEFKEEAKELKHEAKEIEHEIEELEAKKVFDVVFNEKYPVKIHGKNQTGLSLKQAAITQGVPIQLDFVLSVELGGGKTDLIGDAQPFKVKDGDRFLAIPNDDNS
jgi:predicted nuclease with TOPRIM domain